MVELSRVTLAVMGAGVVLMVCSNRVLNARLPVLSGGEKKIPLLPPHKQQEQHAPLSFTPVAAAVAAENVTAVAADYMMLRLRSARARAALPRVTLLEGLETEMQPHSALAKQQQLRHDQSIHNASDIALVPLQAQQAQQQRNRDADHNQRACLHKALYAEMGFYEHPKLMWRKGCNYPPILDFAAWAEGTGCGKGTAVQNPLIMHVAWSGPWSVTYQMPPPPPPFHYWTPSLLLSLGACVLARERAMVWERWSASDGVRACVCACLCARVRAY
jgi:hypothetical protein